MDSYWILGGNEGWKTVECCEDGHLLWDAIQFSYAIHDLNLIYESKCLHALLVLQYIFARVYIHFTASLLSIAINLFF